MTKRVRIAAGWSLAVDGDMAAAIDEDVSDMVGESGIDGLTAVPVVFASDRRTVRVIVYSLAGSGLTGADLAGAVGEVIARDDHALVLVDSSWHEPGDGGWLLTGRGGAPDTTAVVLASSLRREDEVWARSCVGSLQYAA